MEEPIYSIPKPKKQFFSEGGEFFDLLDRLQSSRLNDQRCVMPPPTQTRKTDNVLTQSMLCSILRLENPPFPLVVTQNSNYWIDFSESNDVQSDDDHNIDSIEVNDTALVYRTYFCGKEHYNFQSIDPKHGPVIISMKLATKSSDYETSHCVIIRSNFGNICTLLSSDKGGPVKALNLLLPEFQIDRFFPIIGAETSEQLANYDEHVIVKSFKFGIIYQKYGQTTEEEIFGNRNHSSALDEFMSMLGRIVQLSNHKGYRGGLDTRHGQTGSLSLYEVFQDREFMFHVSTLLPFQETDSQQLQRKRHIGNDIVAIIFQDGDTPFAPEMITSHFIHAYIIVRPLKGLHSHVTTEYKVGITARSDVPYFGPNLPPQGIFKKGNKFKEFLLTKLINAEHACYKAEKFAKLQQRTRVTLLADLYQSLESQTQLFFGGFNTDVGGNSLCKPTRTDDERLPVLTTLVTSVKKAFGSKTRTNNMINADENCDKKMSTISSIYDYVENKDSTLDVSNVFRDGFDGYVEKSDSGCDSVDTGSSGRRSISSPITTNVQYKTDESFHHHHVMSISAPNASEDDVSSLSSLELEHNDAKDDGSTTFLNGHKCYKIDPECQNIISGPVTLVSVQGDAIRPSMAQCEKLSAEISRLKADKLELLRQNIGMTHESNQYHKRERSLHASLEVANKEIQCLRMNLQKALDRNHP